MRRNLDFDKAELMLYEPVEKMPPFSRKTLVFIRDTIQCCCEIHGNDVRFVWLMASTSVILVEKLQYNAPHPIMHGGFSSKYFGVARIARYGSGRS